MNNQLLDVNAVKAFGKEFGGNLPEKFPEIPRDHLFVAIFRHKSSPLLIKAQVISEQSYEWLRLMVIHKEVSEESFYLLPTHHLKKCEKEIEDLTPTATT